jgi:hypothetical protein
MKINKTITTSLGRKTDSKTKMSVEGITIKCCNKKRFLYKFHKPIFYGMGEFSEWMSRQIKMQTSIIGALQSGIQQGGKPSKTDLKAFKFIKKNLNTAFKI